MILDCDINVVSYFEETFCDFEFCGLSDNQYCKGFLTRYPLFCFFFFFGATAAKNLPVVMINCCR